jgi:hypothetical protein
MRRDAVVPRTSIFVIAAVAAATCVISACGPIKMGAAAITGDQRITTATLSNEVSHLQQAYQAGRGSIRLQFPLSEAPQQVLSWMLRFKIRDQLAVRNHLSVTPGDSQRALAALERQTGRTGPAFVQLAVANGLPPDMLPALGRYEAIQNAMLTRLDGGTLPRSTAQVQQLSAVLSQRQCVAAKTLNIQVNPEFGQLDYASLSVIPSATSLAAPPTPSPSPTVRPQLTPKC